MTGGLYELVMASAPSEARKPATVRSSAAVVPWRRVDGQLEVFWVERSRELRFMGGFHAFPGGGRVPADADLVIASRPIGVGKGPVEGDMPSAVLGNLRLEPLLAPGILGCTIRELFEETGLLLADGGDSRRLSDDRRRVLENEESFCRIALERGWKLDASALVYAGRWLTPPLGPVRFDNRFFLLEWPTSSRQQPQIWDGELVAGEWIRPSEAMSRWKRGEVITAPPVLHILLVLAEDGPEAGLNRLRSPIERNLGPFRWVEFRPGVVLFPLATATLPPADHTNCFVLGTEEAVLIDPGSSDGEQLKGLIVALRQLESRGRSVGAIWLTHHHPDHVGGVGFLRRELDLPVCAHALTAERLASVGLEVDRALADGERIVLAGRPPFPVRVVHTPGHARGHLAFLDETYGSLIAGDLTAGLGTIVIDPPEGNMDDYLQSLKKARGLGARALFPAHGPPTISVAAKLDAYVEHRLWREARVLDGWRRGLRGRTLLETAYEDTPREALVLAQRQLLAHLDRLEASGDLPSGSASELDFR